MHRPGLAAALVACCAAATAQDPPPAPAAAALRQFVDHGGTFHLDLPDGWRQLAPGEALRLRELPGCPTDLRTAQPRAFYAIGPVDRWLQGDFASPWLYVVEQGNEWHVEGDFAAALAARWRERGEATGVRYELADVVATQLGPRGHPVRTAVRTARPAQGPAVTSLDVHAPSGGRQYTLSLCAWDADFSRWRPAFDKWLATLEFARPGRGQQQLGDRLWSPILTGALVGLVLVVLYRHTRGKR